MIAAPAPAFPRSRPVLCASTGRHNARLRRMLAAASVVIAVQWAVIAYLIVRSK